MRFFLVTALLLAPALASADGTASRASDASKMQTDDCARARKANRPCVINMGEGDTIEGATPTAGGSAIGIARFGKASSLIHIRTHFITEILKSAEDID